MSVSDAAENAILLLIFNATAWANYADNAASSPETTTALALHTADPGDAGTMSTSEATYTSYARGSVARTSGGWTVSGTSPTQAALTSDYDFPTNTGTSQDITHFSVGKSGGGAAAILFSGVTAPSLTLANSDFPRLTASTVCTLD